MSSPRKPSCIRLTHTFYMDIASRIFQIQEEDRAHTSWNLNLSMDVRVGRSYELTMMSGVYWDWMPLLFNFELSCVKNPWRHFPTLILEMRLTKPPAPNVTLVCYLRGRLLPPKQIYIGMKRKWSLRPWFSFQKILMTNLFGNITLSTEALQDQCILRP